LPGGLFPFIHFINQCHFGSRAGHGRPIVPLQILRAEVDMSDLVAAIVFVLLIIVPCLLDRGKQQDKP